MVGPPHLAADNHIVLILLRAPGAASPDQCVASASIRGSISSYPLQRLSAQRSRWNLLHPARLLAIWNGHRTTRREENRFIRLTADTARRQRKLREGLVNRRERHARGLLITGAADVRRPAWLLTAGAMATYQGRFQGRPRTKAGHPAASTPARRNARSAFFAQFSHTSPLTSTS